jgi:hypothetical protein
MPSPPSDVRKPGLLPLLVILAASAVLYLPCLRFDFVYDDKVQILGNPRLLSWSYVPSYFQHHIWIHISQTGSYYRPLFLLWLRLNMALWGQNAALWHASTLLLHLVAIALVYFLLRRTVGDPFVVAIATAIFALHPAHIESVAWISGLTDSLMTIPLVGSLLIWLEFRERKRITLLIAALALFVVALMVKETAAITPFIVLVYSYTLSREERRAAPIGHALRGFAAFALVFAGYWAMRWRVLRGEYASAIRPLREAIFNLPAMTWFYAKHLLWPVRLSVIYDFELTHATGMAVLAMILIAVVLAAGFMAARRSSILLMAWAWIVFPIAVAIGGVTTFDPHDYVHDRYLYLPTLGLGITLGWALQHLRGRTPELFGRPALQVVAVIGVIGGLSYATEVQLAPWTNNLTLFSHAVQTAPENPVAYEHLAFEMYQRNDPMAAINLYKKSVALDPHDYRANFGLAVMLYRMQDWQDADTYCGHADEIAPESNNACYELQTMARINLGKWEAAEQPIRTAIRIWPTVTGQHLLLGRILVHQGRVEEARSEFARELQLDPNSSDAQIELQQLAR